MKISSKKESFISGVLLASGSSTRFGSPKQLLKWSGNFLINHMIDQILQSGIDHLFVILGAYYEDIKKVINHDVSLIYNNNWRDGKSSSIKSGIAQLVENTLGVIFFVVDQPYLNRGIIDKLILEHQKFPDHIIVPRIHKKISNPVLFGKNYFYELNKLEGENGGKIIIENSQKIKWIDWYDEKLLLDIDTKKDYKNLIDNIQD